MKLTYLLIGLVLSIAFIGVVIATGTAPTISAHNVTGFSHNISVLFNFTGNGTFYINNTDNFTINKTGYFQNTTALPTIATLYWINLSANESEANLTDSFIIWINVTDSTPPVITTYNMTFEYGSRATAWYNQTDNYLFGNWSVNDTTNLVMNDSGYIQNITQLTPAISLRRYWITVSGNDSVNNTITSVLWINITDTTTPVINILNQSYEYSGDGDASSVAYLISYTENYDLSNFSVNDTTNFRINKTGYLENITALANATTYWLTVTANDTMNRTVATTMWVNITNSSNPVLNANNLTIEFNDAAGVRYQTVISENARLSNFSVNNTLNLTINTTGYLRNSTVMLNNTIYLLTVTVNDTLNNTDSSPMWINITPSVAPAISAHVISITYGNAVAVQFNGTDNVGIDSFSVNETVNFSISKTGYFQSILPLWENRTYLVQLTLNDTINNTYQQNITVTITQPTGTTTTVASGSGTSTIASSSDSTSTVTTTIEETAQITWDGLVAGEPTFVAVDDQEMGFLGIWITTTENVSTGTLVANRVMAPVDTTPNGNVYKYLDINVDGLSNEKIEKVVMSFRIEKTWVSNNNLSAESVKLTKYVDNSWTVLETIQTGEDDTYYIYNATTTGFSYFAITAQFSGIISADILLLVGIVIVVIIGLSWFVLVKKGKLNSNFSFMNASKSYKSNF